MRPTKQLSDEFAELKTQLAAVIEAMTRVANNKDDAASFSIPEFCKRHRFSEAQYHKLKREGRGPRVMTTGSMGVRISRAAEADWIIEREREAEQRKAAQTAGAEATPEPA
jgi:hypothetical protein